MTNSELLARRQAAVVRGVSQATPIFAERALNSEIWDVEGKRYVDFAGGIAVLNTGHCHPRIVEAIRGQLDRFTHTCFQVLPYEGYIRLAERLNQLAPINGPLKSILLSTGAEATENAVKIARAATGRSGVIAFTGGFHGRTAFASAMTGKVIPYKKALGPPLPGVWHVPFPVAGSDVTVDDALRCISFIFKADIDASQVAAIIIEPVQGEGGFHQAPAELMRGLRRICDENGIVLIADEVQTGFGRTGKMFAMEHYDVQADIVCVAKSLGGGMPLSGVIGRAAIMEAAEPGGLGGTYAGNPLACAAALAVLDVFEEENLIARANQIGERLRNAIDRFALSNTLVPTSPARGPGAMVAFDILKQRGSNEPDAEMTKRVTRLAYENGLILLSCGTAANTIRILVPLTASDAIVDEGLAILERCLAA
ncbi:MAG: 4-aminobutyrate--2-oxoglutarate transaminase [Rhodopseudomonas palustris]|uniref:4-aminobutyrate--2-oxoglutarate transaminase n=1 Tax=Rhodopseudomonas palustris TaxID=1076 RepID=A0A933VXV2_RHOPL|nr:4-aminobutyrate--2-oxoglutarate transaminase [Rhodopseudomonas palustris]